MTPAAPPPSSRLLRAVDAERAELDRHREKLLAAREDLRAELARIEAGLTEVDERQRLLDCLSPTPAAATPDDRDDDAGRRSEPELDPRRRTLASVSESGTVLRGTAIREAAVRLLLSRRDEIEAIHYRDWFEMFTREGYTVVGKDPLAIFLTQISRSPVVRRSTQAGVYELDTAAPTRLHRQLDDLHEQLRELTATPQGAADLAAIRARRHELTTELGHVEKALEEAMRVLEADRSANGELAAAVG